MGESIRSYVDAYDRKSWRGQETTSKAVSSPRLLAARCSPLSRFSDRVPIRWVSGGMEERDMKDSGEGRGNVTRQGLQRQQSETAAGAVRQLADIGSPPLLDYAAAAAYLGATQSFLRRLVLEKRVRYYKVGKFVRFRVEDLDAFVDEGRVDPQDLRAKGSPLRRSPRRYSA